ncbi:uncharacterized protein LOC112639658 [Camponotus floridanus]|uniref:uncharacterized protein LOC112639658 n=1 Tax=Camponotus floridanus TaxID=104421 RepID=UPI000DC67C6C|nr:uncharacterized protein LOC112639658 [Camponotus floridanus]
MIDFVAQNIELNRILLLIVGLWPLQQSNLTRLQFIFMSAIMTGSITFLMKDLLIQLQYICNGLRDKNEIAIMKKYNYIASRYTTAFTITIVSTMFGYILMIFWPDIMHIILPNITQTHQLPIKMEYFIDQEKYFFWIALYIGVELYLGITSFIGIGSFLIMYIQCICGMFRISRLSKLLMFKLETMMFCLIVFHVISLSLNLFQVSSILCLYNYYFQIIYTG